MCWDIEKVRTRRGRRDKRAAFAAAYTVNLAHGFAYERIKSAAPKSSVGITEVAFNYISYHRDGSAAEAVRRASDLNNGIFIEPVALGTYPASVIETEAEFLPEHRSRRSENHESLRLHGAAILLRPTCSTTTARKVRLSNSDSFPFSNTPRWAGR